MNKEPKILFLDIETSPNLAYVWGKWEQDVIEFKEEWHLLSFSAKWRGGKQVTKGLCDYKNKKEGDYYLVLDLYKLLDEADVIVAHNGDQFDIKKIQARFAFWNLKPTSPFKTVDTKKVAKRYFNFNSNSLNDLGVTLGFGKKEKHDGFETWKGCMSNDKKSWAVMKKYNAKDVILLERVYDHFLPWISNHPNFSTFLNKEVCPKCGGKHLQSRGLMRTLTATFKRFQCQDCGGWGRFRNNEEKVASVVNI